MSSRKPDTDGVSVSLIKGKARHRAPFLFLLPALLVVFAVLIFPIVFSFFVSGFNWPLSEGAGVRKFVGLGNYLALSVDPEFWNSLKLQLGFIFIAIPIELLFGFAAASSSTGNFSALDWCGVFSSFPSSSCPYFRA